MLRSLISELGIEGRTHVTGLLRGRERLEALADADVVVYPSEHEVFGLVPLEALLSGTPVIVADDCGCGDIVSALGGGLVTPLGDVDALASSIDAVLGSSSHWREAAALAGVRVRSAYGHDVVTTELEAVYQALVPRFASRRPASDTRRHPTPDTGHPASASRQPSASSYRSTTARFGCARHSRESCRKPTAGPSR